MALTNYTELKASIADWLNRADLTSQIPDFIALAEAGFNRELRTVQMEVMSDGAWDEDQVPVPLDWLETRTFRLENPAAGSALLEYVGEAEWDSLQTQGLSGTTRYYTIINGVFQVLPPVTTSQSYILRYYAQIPALSDTNQTNWLLAKSPDLYLYSSLLSASGFLKDDERIPVWATGRQAIIQNMMLESERAKYSRVRLAARRTTFG
jgi:hypothetical protein